LRTNFPVSLERTVSVEKENRGQAIHTFPIVQEDGLSDEIDVKKRTELQASNKWQFLAIWRHALLGNLGNSAWNMVLVHPSYGIGTKPENLQVKIDAIADFARIAKKFDVRFEAMDTAGAYWRGRDGVKVAVWWDPAKGYSGTLHVGAEEAPRYSLEFADDIASFACPEAPEFTVRGRRVVFTKPLPAGKLLTFTAKP
jgi:hypothetical protein